MSNAAATSVCSLVHSLISANKETLFRYVYHVLRISCILLCLYSMIDEKDINQQPTFSLEIGHFVYYRGGLSVNKDFVNLRLCCLHADQHCNNIT